MEPVQNRFRELVRHSLWLYVGVGSPALPVQNRLRELARQRLGLYVGWGRRPWSQIEDLRFRLVCVW